MTEDLTFELGNDPVRFTPDGRVAVIDAIRAVSDTEGADALWRELTAVHPDLLDRCDQFAFPRQQSSVPVADSDGWDHIQATLFDYILERHFK